MVTMLQMVLRFGFFTLFGLFRVTTHHKLLFQNFFTLYNVKDYISSIQRIFPDFYLLQNAKEFLMQQYGIKQSFLETLFEPGVRSIYSQNLDNYNIIAALVNVQASNSATLRTFKHGNRNFFETAVRMITCQARYNHLHLNQSIVSIEKKTESYVITLEDGSTREFDAVVIAVPLEVSGISFINLEKVNKYIQSSSREFIKTHLATVKGKVNPAYFGLSHPSQVPNLITTTKTSEHEACPFLSVQTLWRSKEDQYTVTKILSKHPISKEQFQQMFLDIQEVQHFEFPYAYPKLRPLREEELKAPTQLDATPGGGLYYINSIETIASAMEASVYSAKNVAHMVVKKLSQ